MQVLSFLTLSLILPIVSSIKCKMECLEVCCKEPQFYAIALEKCVNIPEDVLVSWLTSIHHNKTIKETVKFVDYAECEDSNDSPDSIAFCESPTNPNALQQKSGIPCERLLEGYFITMLIGRIYLCVQLICIPTMVVYTCRKGFKENFTFKLVSRYMVSILVNFVLPYLIGVLSSTIDSGMRKYVGVVTRFWGISTWLWLNVIGFHVWSDLRRANGNDNCEKNQRRFICYSIYVWGIAAIFTGLSHLLSGALNSFIVELSVLLVIPCFNLLTFIILSLNICITRCRVVNLANVECFILKLTSLILHLGLMMGIPRMILIVLQLFFGVNMALFILFTDLEPFVIFIVLLWNPKNCFNSNFV